MSRGSVGTLPAGPFVEWAEMIAAEVGDMTVVERLMGIDNQTFARAVRRARTQQKVSLGLVDRSFTAAQQPHMLAILYPQDVESMEDRLCSTCVELVTVGDDGLCPWCNTTVNEPRAERAQLARARARSSWRGARSTRGELAQTSDERRRRAKELRAAGLSYSAIACRLGVARSTAHGYVNAGS